MPITLEDIKTALAIIDQCEGREISLRHGDLTLIVRRGDPGPAPDDVGAGLVAAAGRAERPAPAAPAGAASAAAPAGAPSATAVPLRSPLSGVIYRAPSPESPPFVEVGTEVGPEDTVCIIDVMKVMNLIKSPSTGRIVRIDAANGQLLNRGDVILWVETAS